MTVTRHMGLRRPHNDSLLGLKVNILIGHPHKISTVLRCHHSSKTWVRFVRELYISNDSIRVFDLKVSLTQCNIQ